MLQEEDRIIKREAGLLKDKVGGRDVTKVTLVLYQYLWCQYVFCGVTQRQMREYLIRLIYCEMLGVECSWGYIHAVKFTQSGSTLDKRIGFSFNIFLSLPSVSLSLSPSSLSPSLSTFLFPSPPSSLSLSFLLSSPSPLSNYQISHVTLTPSSLYSRLPGSLPIPSRRP